MAETEVPARSAVPVRVDLFEYPATAVDPSRPPWPGWEEPAPPSSPPVAQADPEIERRIAEEARKAFETGRERGRQEGRAAQQQAQAAAQEAAAERQRQQALALVASFAQERDRYIERVEHEVVELALAIAARILRREAQMDPLLLTGAVRVALGQLSSSTSVRLKVPPLEEELWEESIAAMPKLALRPEVVAEEGMKLGECRIEAELGSVDLGLRAQLGEIERGFFDRVGPSAAESNPVVRGQVHNTAQQAAEPVLQSISTEARP